MCLRLQLAVDLGPIGLGVPAMALLAADPGEEPRLQCRIGQFRRQRPAEPRHCQPLQRQSDGRRRQIEAPGDLVAGHPGGRQTKHLAHMAHRCPLCWHPLPHRQRPKPRGRKRAGRGAVATAAYPGDIIPEWQATSSRDAERHQIGLAGDIIPDSRATSPGCSSRNIYREKVTGA
jgi:hypothetical protein